MVSCGFRAMQEMRNQKCDFNPVIAKKAGEWLQESLKNTFRNTAWFSREKEHISQGVGSSCSSRGASPWVRLTPTGSWDSPGSSFPAETRLQFSCWVDFSSAAHTNYLFLFTTQKEKHILSLFAWFRVIKDGCGKAGWGHAIKWHRGIKQKSKPKKNPKLRPSRIIKEVVKQRGNGLLVSLRRAERAG